jgi:hypothetical protein
MDVTRASIQLLGGIGFTWEHDAPSWTVQKVAAAFASGRVGRSAPSACTAPELGRQRRIRTGTVTE